MRPEIRPFARTAHPSGTPVARVLALALALIAACGGGGGGGGADGSDLQVHGAAILVDSAAPFTAQPDFPSRLESTLTAALEYWGGSWSDLARAKITFVDDDHVACGGNPSAIGCYSEGEIRLSTRDAGSTFHCVEETVLVHEVGHAVIGDPGHTDPRWMDFDSVVQALAGKPGYDASGETPCDIYVNVWRHPPDSP
jgi:hypothetical protein